MVIATFVNGIASISIDGADKYGACIVQNISSNDHIVYRNIHYKGSKQVSVVAKTYTGATFDGNLTLIVVMVS